MTDISNCLESLEILIAEDYPDSRDFLQMLLEDTVQHVDIAQNGQQALEQLSDQDYDVVLMDCNMPVMDGYEATRLLRQREGQTQHTAVIGLTANIQAGDREKCLAAGMDEYLPKPIIVDDLIKLMLEISRSAAVF